MNLASRSRLTAIYQELGGGQAGEEHLRKILRDFYARMHGDVMIGFFFEGKVLDEIAERQLGFLLKAMGASETYAGKSPQDAHSELPPILAGHFDRRRVILEQTLNDHALSQDSISSWLAFEDAFRSSIVTPAP